MNKNLHDTDDFFKSAYQEFEERPSVEVWEKISTRLNKKALESNRKKLTFWRKSAIILLLVLTGLVLSDSTVFKPGKKNALTAIPKSYTIQSPENHPEISNQEKDLAGKENIIPKNNLFLQQQAVSIIPLGAATLNVIKGNDNNHGLLTESLSISLTTTPEKWNKPYLLTASLNNKIQVRVPAADDLPIKKDDKKNTKERKVESFTSCWMVTPFVSYERAGYRLDSDLPTNITSIKHREVQEPSFSGGILTTRQFTKHWGLQAGLIYSNTAIGISPQKMYAFQNTTGDIVYKYITSSGFAYIRPGFGTPPSFGDSLTSSEAKHKIEKITVPLMAKYRIGNRRVSLVPGAGIEANFITKATLEVDIEDSFNREIVVVNKLNGIKSFYWSAVVDAELQYKLNKKISLNLRPAYRFAISPMTKNNIVETFPHSLGLGGGVTIKF
jgi:hypothetical protein